MRPRPPAHARSAARTAASTTAARPSPCGCSSARAATPRDIPGRVCLCNALDRERRPRADPQGRVGRPAARDPRRRPRGRARAAGRAPARLLGRRRHRLAARREHRRLTPPRCAPCGGPSLRPAHICGPRVGARPTSTSPIPTIVADPYPAFARMREQGRAVWDDGLGMWLAFRYDDANAVLRDRRLGRICRPREPETVWETFNWLHEDALLENEPPKHTRLQGAGGQGVLARHDREPPRPHPGAVPRAARRLRGQARRDRHASTSSRTTPSRCPVAGHRRPARRARVRRRAAAPVVAGHREDVRVRPHRRGRRAARRRACDEFAAYVAELARAPARCTRRRPGHPPRAGRVRGRAAHRARAGRHRACCCSTPGTRPRSTASATASSQLLDRPDQWAAVVDDPWGVAATAVEEMLRYDTPSQLFERTATQDVEVAGVDRARGAEDRRAARVGQPRPRGVRRRRPVRRRAATRTRTSRSAPASTSASARRWPGWRCSSRCRCWPSGSRPCARPAPAVPRGTFVLRGWESVPVTV